MGRAVPPHWIRPNESQWTPRRIICLDTESQQVRTERGYLHTFRLASATFDRRDGSPHPQTPEREAAFTDAPQELVDWIVARTVKSHVTYLYAHNLGFDAAVGGIVTGLMDRGWKVTTMSSVHRGVWARLQHDGRSLVLADSSSILPASLAEVGRLLGLEKPQRSTDPLPAVDPMWAGTAWAKLPLPADDDGQEVWLERCRRDAAILREAVLGLMDWWDAEGLGHWSPTGPGCGWAALRHRFYTHPILAHRDPEATKMERAANHGGRREIYFRGQLPRGRYPYLDFSAQYATICSDTDLPIRFLRTYSNIDVEAYARRPRNTGLIARVEVTTSEPLVPVRTDTGTVYPTGTFRTTLASPEIDLLLAKGAQVRIMRGAYYQLGPALAAWGRWVLDRLRADPPDIRPVCRLALRGWSRSVVGKFAQQRRDRTKIGDTGPGIFSARQFIDNASGAKGTIMELGGEVFENVVGGEPDNAAPAVAAWVASEARVRLWEAMEAAGRKNVLWCDTDGMILNGRSSPDPKQAQPAKKGRRPAPFLRTDWWMPKGWRRRVRGDLRVKTIYQKVTLWLPGEWEGDGKPIVKGLPVKSVQTGPRRFSTELWPGLFWQLEHHGGTAFETWVRDFHLKRDYLAGQVLASGRIEPHVMVLDKATNRILSRAPP